MMDTDRMVSIPDDGTVEIANLAGKRYKLTVRATGYAPESLWIEQLAPEEVLVREVALERGATVAGYVTDPDGKRVGAAMVYVSAGRLTNEKQRCGSRGEFQLTELPRGVRARLYARMSGYVDSEKVEIVAGQQDEPVVLPPCQHLVGQPPPED